MRTKTGAATVASAAAAERREKGGCVRPREDQNGKGQRGKERGNAVATLRGKRRRRRRRKRGRRRNGSREVGVIFILPPFSSSSPAPFSFFLFFFLLRRLYSQQLGISRATLDIVFAASRVSFSLEILPARRRARIPILPVSLPLSFSRFPSFLIPMLLPVPPTLMVLVSRGCRARPTRSLTHSLDSLRIENRARQPESPGLSVSRCVN